MGDGGWEIGTGTEDDAISYCLANPDCIKVQWDSSGNIFVSGVLASAET